jgi:hypothetical protein
MLRFTAKARKYLVALAGIGLLVAMRYLDVEIPGLPDIVRDLIAGAVIAEAVYQAPNGDAS